MRKKSVLNSNIKLGTSLATCVFMALASVSVVSAASDYSIKQCHTGKDSISVYVDSDGVSIDSAACQIGRLESEQVTVTPISELDTPLRTLFLLDNSLSITNEYRPEISEIITGVIDGHLDGEQFRLATIDTDIHYLGDYSTDYDELKSQIGTIEYSNQDTYFTDHIYNVLKELSSDNDPVYSRIVVISDGADDMAIGVKGSEADALAKSSNIPVYALGVVYKNNTERLKNMFALSRSTGASYYNLKETSASEVIEGLAADRKLTDVEVFPPREQLDGSSMSMKLTLHTAQGDKDLNADVKMPFGDADSAKAAEAVEATSEKTEAEPIIQQEEVKQEETEESAVPTYKILLFILILLLAALYFWNQKRSKDKSGEKKEDKKKSSKNKENKKKSVPVKVPGQEESEKKKAEEAAKAEAAKKAAAEKAKAKADSESESETVILTDADEETVIEGADEDATVIDAGGGPVLGDPAPVIRKHTIVIRDKNDPTNNARFTLDKRVVIGRKKELNDFALTQDRRVSSQHCYIEQNEMGEIELHDLNSTNGLICNGLKVDKMVVLKETNVLGLGSTELEVKIFE